MRPRNCGVRSSRLVVISLVHTNRVCYNIILVSTIYTYTYNIYNAYFCCDYFSVFHCCTCHTPKKEATKFRNEKETNSFYVNISLLLLSYTMSTCLVYLIAILFCSCYCFMVDVWTVSFSLIYLFLFCFVLVVCAIYLLVILLLFFFSHCHIYRYMKYYHLLRNFLVHLTYVCISKLCRIPHHQYWFCTYLPFHPFRKLLSSVLITKNAALDDFLFFTSNRSFYYFQSEIDVHLSMLR